MYMKNKMKANAGTVPIASICAPLDSNHHQKERIEQSWFQNLYDY